MKYKIERRFSSRWFPWLLDPDNPWQLVSLHSTEERAKSRCNDHQLRDSASEYRVTPNEIDPDS